MAKDATAVWEKIVLLGDELYLAWLVPGQLVAAEFDEMIGFWPVLTKAAVSFLPSRAV